MEGLLKNKNGSSVLLRIHDDMAFLPLATSFVEKAALAYGLADPEAMALTLATEEIFAYLSRPRGQTFGDPVHKRRILREGFILLSHPGPEPSGL